MSKKSYPITEEPESVVPDQFRLQRVLAMAGVGSRRHCEEYVLAGRVTVDGETVRELGARVDPDSQEVRLDGDRVFVERKVYYMLNKPIGFLCTQHDPAGRTRVTDLFPRRRERLFTVGRLDENSQGLLLVTNDGELAHQLAHPRFRVPKVYRVHVAGVPTREILEQLRVGMHFSDGKFKVAGVKQLKIKGKSAVLEIVLNEGQNREIRRLLARVGHKVLTLERVALGPLKLGSLAIGAHRPLNAEELKELHRFVLGRHGPRTRTKKVPGESRSKKLRAPRTETKTEAPVAVERRAKTKASRPNRTPPRKPSRGARR